MTVPEGTATGRLAAMTAFDAFEDLVSIFAPDGTYLYINPAGQALLGKTRGELVGRRYLAVFPDLRGHPFDRAFERVSRRESVVERLEVFYEPMGLWSDQTVYLADDDHVVVVCRNTTAQKSAEFAGLRMVAELAASKQKLEEALARAASLTTLATNLSTTRTPEEVSRVVTNEGKRASSADLCTLYVLSDDGLHLELIGAEGVAPELVDSLRRIPASVSERAVWVEGDADYEALVPEVARSPKRRAKAFWSVPLVAEGERIGLLGMGFASPRSFAEEERVFVDTFTKQCAQALLRAVRFTREATARELERRERVRGEFLAAAAKELSSSSLDYRATLTTVARLVVPRLADWCAVDLLEPGGATPQHVAIAHLDPAKVELARALRARYPAPSDADMGVPNVIRTGRAELYPDVRPLDLEASAIDTEHLHLLREIGLVSAMIVPLRGRVDTFGAITFAYSESARHYTSEDLAFAEDFAHRAALAIENARALSQVEEAKRLLDTVLDRMPSGLVVIGPDGNATLTNRRATEIYGLLAAPTLADDSSRAGWRFTSHGQPLSLENWPTARSRLLGEEIRQEEVELQRPDGRQVFVSINSSPLRDGHGTIVGAVAVFDDVTTQKLAQRERAQYETFRELFLGMLGHDLRSPLSAIVMGSNLIAMRGALNADDLRVVQRIMSASARMGRMIEQILDFTRARSAGGIPVVRGRVDAEDILANVVAEAQVGRADATVQVDVVGRTSGSWDGDRLAQAFSNLVGNAIEHGVGPVRVALLEAGERLVVRVHNDGEPIVAEMQGLLFDPFRQGGSRGKRSQGLGLGLYITHQIALAHGGTLEVRSAAGEGTTFELCVPYEPSPSGECEPANRGPSFRRA